MTDGHSMLIKEPAGAPKRSAPVQDFMRGWSLLLWLGWLFVLVGLLNLVLIWIPVRFGSPEFEFASVASSLDSMPLPAMGLVFALAASRAKGSLGSARLATVLCWVLAAVVVSGLVLYWLDVPLALKAVTDPTPRLGIKKSIVKVSAQGVLYPIILGGSAWLGNRR